MTTYHGAHAPPVPGKTFSLFGTADAAEGYYRAVGELADACLVRQPDTAALIAEVRRLGKRPRLARRLSSGDGPSFAHFLVQTASTRLSPYTQAVHQHLRELSLLKRLDGVLSFTEEQHHLAMLEIELMNRACVHGFRSARRRLAFLPHCLRDLDANCRSAPQNIDYVCKGCSTICHVNAVSTLLRENRIEPYIWMEAGLKKLFRELKDKEGGLGVMGIACVPELVRGMRMCAKLSVPVVGVPLNANRCGRWMGEFLPTSINLDAVGRLLA